MEGNEESYTGLWNMIQEGSWAVFQPPPADIPACQPASSANSTDEAPEGPGCMPTHSNTEALWVSMRRWLCVQGPVWVSQCNRANTCLDFYHKAPEAPQSMSPEIAVLLLLCEFGIWDRARERERLKTRRLGISTKTNKRFSRAYSWLLLHPANLHMWAAAQHNTGATRCIISSDSAEIKWSLKMKLKSVFLTGFLCLHLICNSHGRCTRFHIILANDAWECW